MRYGAAWPGGTGGDRKKKEWKKGGKTRSSYNKTPRRVSQVETARDMRERERANRGTAKGGRKGERERSQEGIFQSEDGGEEKGKSIGRIYICMSAEGTMYSNCEKKGCTFLRGKVAA